MLAYSLALITCLFFINGYDKYDSHFYVNSFVGNRYLNAFFYYITYLGDGRMVAFIILAVAAVNTRLGLYVGCAFLSATLTSIALKYFFFDDVNRPFFVFQYLDPRRLNLVEGVDMHIHNSFPSGHATQAFSVLMCLVFAARSQGMKLLFFALALVTAFSRMYLSQHWLADITAGSFVGFCCAVAFYFPFLRSRRFSRFDRPLATLFKKQHA
jgi:membrane-associated phospholipid phosphatase